MTETPTVCAAKDSEIIDPSAAKRNLLGDLDSKDTRRLTGDDSNAVYSAGSSGQGYLLFVRNLALVVKQFDATRLLLEGEPSTIADQVSVNTSGYPAPDLPEIF